MPNAVALVGEYSPRRSRVSIMLIVANGFTAGGGHRWRYRVMAGSGIWMEIGVLCGVRCRW